MIQVSFGFGDGMQGSKIIIPDESIAFRVTLEDAFNQALSRVILLVGTLVELVGALSCSSTLGLGTRSTGCLTTGALAFFRDSFEPSSKCFLLLLFNFGTQLTYLQLVLVEVDSVQRHKRRDPNLELCSERLILV